MPAGGAARKAPEAQKDNQTSTQKTKEKEPKKKSDKKEKSNKGSKNTEKKKNKKTEKKGKKKDSKKGKNAKSKKDKKRRKSNQELLFLARNPAYFTPVIQRMSETRGRHLPGIIHLPGGAHGQFAAVQPFHQMQAHIDTR